MNQFEKKFNSWLRDHLPGDYMRVENTTMQGVPDINVCDKGVEIWIESKIYYPQYKSPLIEKEQYAWGYRRTKNGGIVWILAHDPASNLIHAYRHTVMPMMAKTKYLAIVKAAEYFTFLRPQLKDVTDRLFSPKPDVLLSIPP